MLRGERTGEGHGDEVWAVVSPPYWEKLYHPKEKWM